jgi:predicted HAD superfamily Cof-like phosphohydrolase
MNKEQKMVKEWHKRFGVLVNEKPTPVDHKTERLRFSLIEEELAELATAQVQRVECPVCHGQGTVPFDGVDVEDCSYCNGEGEIIGDIERIADALGDLLYVVYGTAVSYGIDMEPVFAEIHRSNMSKGDPEVVRASNGKILKSRNWTPPNLKPLIEMAKPE